jgi:cell division protein FtsX
MLTKDKVSQGLLLSLLGALLGIGLIVVSVHLGARDDFLARLFLYGGDFADYGYFALLISGFIAGIVLIAKHILKEGVAENFYEHTPY